MNDMNDMNDMRWHAWVEASGAFPAQPKEYKKVVPDFRLADKWCCLYVRNKWQLNRAVRSSFIHMPQSLHHPDTRLSRLQQHPATEKALDKALDTWYATGVGFEVNDNS